MKTRKKKLRIWELTFTLIELLVVISIITILASLLLPSLQKAKDATKGIACINNLSQWGKAVISYMDDNNGYFPCPDRTHGVSNSFEPLFSMDMIAVYYLNGPIFKKPMAGMVWPSDWNAQLDVFICPATGTRLYSQQYCYNNYACAPPADYGYHYKMNTVQNPSSFILMADTMNGSRMSYGDYSNTDGTPLHISYRHLKKTNTLRADGHAEGTKTNTIGQRYWILGY